jgi:uncharacterized protein (DUF362 family)
VIKINLVITKTRRYSDGVELATTPFQAVKSYIDFISPFYDKEIIIAEQSTWGKTKVGFETYGFAELAEGKLVLPFSKTLLEAPFLVSIARPKTHCSVVATAGIKNALVGAINGSWKDRLKIHKGTFIHNIIASLADIVYPHMVIIDGTVGMEGNGPIRGTEINAGWTLASLDALAADSLAAYLMGFGADDVGYLKMLRKKGSGFFYPQDRIEILGEEPKDLITPFKPHRNFRKQKRIKLRNKKRGDNK